MSLITAQTIAAKDTVYLLKMTNSMEDTWYRVEVRQPSTGKVNYFSGAEFSSLDLANKYFLDITKGPVKE